MRRDIDMLVGRLVMGLSIEPSMGDGYLMVREDAGDPTVFSYYPVPLYTSDIAAAWQVVQKLTTTDDIIIESTADGWRVHFDQSPRSPGAWAPTAPHAICLEALRVIGYDTVVIGQ